MSVPTQTESKQVVAFLTMLPPDAPCTYWCETCCTPLGGSTVEEVLGELDNNSGYGELYRLMDYRPTRGHYVVHMWHGDDYDSEPEYD